MRLLPRPGSRLATIGRGAAAGVASRIATVASSLVSFPLLLDHLGTRAFGVWATITSLSGLLAFADLGLGTGTVNLVTDAQGRGDDKATRSVTASSYALLVGIGVFIAVATLAAAHFWNLGVIVGSDSPVAETGVLVFALGLAITIPLSVVTRLQVAFRETGSAYLWVGLGALFALLGNAISVILDLGLVAAVATTMAGPIVALMINSVVFFHRRRWLLPTLAQVEGATVKVLLPAGAAFFVQQIGLAVGYQSDAVVIGQILGPAAVASYVLPAKLFFFGPVLLNFVLLPVWPEIRHALARGEAEFVRRTCRRMVVFTAAVTAPGALFLYIAGPSIVDVWSSGVIQMSSRTTLAFTLWVISACMVTAVSFMLSGFAAHRTIGFIYGSMACLNIALSIVLAHHLGISGVAFATAASNLACIVIPGGLAVRDRVRALVDHEPVAVDDRSDALPTEPALREVPDDSL